MRVYEYVMLAQYATPTVSHLTLFGWLAGDEHMMILAVFLPLAGLLLSALLLLWVLYANAFRGLYCVLSWLNRGFSSGQPENLLIAEDLTSVPSIRVQVLQVNTYKLHVSATSVPGAKEVELQQLDIEAMHTGGHPDRVGSIGLLHVSALIPMQLSSTLVLQSKSRRS